MNVICPTHIECPGSDFPILNISSEAPDFFCFWNYIYNVNNCATRLNCNPAESFARDCFSIVCSNISQAEADLQARLAQANCNLMAVPPPGPTPGPTPNPPPPPQTCSNEPQTATVYCSNGDAVSFTTPAGTFSSPNSGDEAACLANVNAQALAYAEQQASAQAQLVCPKPECTINTTSPLPTATQGTAYSKQIVGAATGSPVLFSINAGALPAGLSLSSSGLISGTPTEAGTFTFTAKLTGNISCTKQFSLEVLPVITSYWTLDEAAFEAKHFDSLGHATFYPESTGSGPGVPALHGNGVQFTQTINSGILGGYNAASPLMDYVAGKSFSYWGWFKIIGQDTGAFFGPFMSFYCFATQQLMIELANTNNPGNVHIGDTRAGNDLYLNVSLGAWHFFHLFHDGSQDKSGFSIDNGAEILLSAAAWQSSAGSMLLAGGAFGPAMNVIFDELGFVNNAKLSSTQVTYLYNGGFGQTWPITLP